MLNVSRESVISVRKVIDQGSEELIQKVDAGEIAVSTAAKIAELLKDKQNEIVACGNTNFNTTNAEIRY